MHGDDFFSQDGGNFQKITLTMGAVVAFIVVVVVGGGGAMFSDVGDTQIFFF